MVARRKLLCKKMINILLVMNKTAVRVVGITFNLMVKPLISTISLAVSHFPRCVRKLACHFKKVSGLPVALSFAIPKCSVGG